ncbi:MAG: ankyrin repeat domain-containing protein [Nitrospinae bacterium]|nr:ankyrin repeat domain-containing protein [Nitrospinota bacterium]
MLNAFFGLMWAAKDNDTEIVNLLLDKGADFKIKNRFGNTALKLAKKRGLRGNSSNAGKSRCKGIV